MLLYQKSFLVHCFEQYSEEMKSKNDRIEVTSLQTLPSQVLNESWLTNVNDWCVCLAETETNPGVQLSLSLVAVASFPSVVSWTQDLVWSYVTLPYLFQCLQRREFRNFFSVSNIVLEKRETFFSIMCLSPSHFLWLKETVILIDDIYRSLFSVNLRPLVSTGKVSRDDTYNRKEKRKRQGWRRRWFFLFLTDLWSSFFLLNLIPSFSTLRFHTRNTFDQVICFPCLELSLASQWLNRWITGIYSSVGIRGKRREGKCKEDKSSFSQFFQLMLELFRREEASVLKTFCFQHLICCLSSI